RQRRPLSFTSFTIAPSVSTCAVSIRCLSVCFPGNETINPPFLLRLVSTCKSFKYDSTHWITSSVYPDGLGMDTNCLISSFVICAFGYATINDSSSVMYSKLFNANYSSEQPYNF